MVTGKPRPFTDRFGSSEADVLYQFPLVQGGTNVLLPTRCVDELYVNTAYPRGVGRVRELVPSKSKKKNPIQIIPDCSGWSLASQTLHRQIWKFRGRRPLPVSSCPRRHQRAVANTLRRRTVRQHGLPKRCKPCKGAGSLREGPGRSSEYWA